MAETIVEYENKNWTPQNLSKYSGFSVKWCKILLEKVLAGQYTMDEIMQRIRSPARSVYKGSDGFKYTPRVLEAILDICHQAACKRIQAILKGEITEEQMLRPKGRHICSMEPTLAVKPLTDQEKRVLELEQKYFPG